MPKQIALIVTIVLLTCFLTACAAAYWGAGSQPVGARHLRTGSLNGPQVQGGGPSAGK